MALAVVSSSANAKPVLAAAGMAERFSFVMDGVEARKRSLPGKPEPDTFVVASAAVGWAPARSVVFEDAVSGVAAGAAGGFAAVVGVDRTGSARTLAEAGATVVVQDLSTLIP
jgi:HAD superfamily hydrolase (TIGR01509 family)